MFRESTVHFCWFMFVFVYLFCCLACLQILICRSFPNRENTRQWSRNGILSSWSNPRWIIVYLGSVVNWAASVLPGRTWTRVIGFRWRTSCSPDTCTRPDCGSCTLGLLTRCWLTKKCPAKDRSPSLRRKTRNVQMMMKHLLDKQVLAFKTPTQYSATC